MKDFMIVSVVMASCLRHPRLHEITSQAMLSLRVDEAWRRKHNVQFHFYLFVNDDQEPPFPEQFKGTITQKLSKRFGSSLENLKPYYRAFDYRSGRSLAESWNDGLIEAFARRSDLCLIIGNDCLLTQGSLELLIESALFYDELDLLSACRSDVPKQKDPLRFGACDFSCVIFKPTTVDNHGFFDVNFRPAYYEDNDYCGRVILGGGSVAVLHEARYETEGSATTKHDPEAAARVNAAFHANLAYFVRKWGRQPANDPEEIKATYFKNPFNDSGKHLSWFER